jgi:hypothetical protein
MPNELDDTVRSIGLDLVSRLAPEELLLYPSLVSQFQSRDIDRDEGSRDQILGFGTGEIVLLMTPMILKFTSGFWDAFIAEAARDALDGVVRQIQQVRAAREHKAQDIPPLTAAQLQLVRKVAEQETRRMKISKDQAALLTDALVGALAAPPNP